MSNLSTDIDTFKQRYREIFLKTSELINDKIEEIKPKISCADCGKDCKIETELFQAFPMNCEYKNWQQNVLALLDKQIMPFVREKWTKLYEYRKNFGCNGCATCCKLACSEFSLSELQEKANNGDNFATQFVSVFIPYESEEEARKIYPEYFELLSEKMQNEKVYFYHCPKLTSDNRCFDYENRPQICRDFPDNPLSILPKSCAFSSWKKEIEPTALELHATLEIVDFYKSKLVD